MFLDNFDVNHDGGVSIDEFEKYYTNVSTSVDDDNHFALIIQQAYNFGMHEYKHCSVCE